MRVQFHLEGSQVNLFRSDWVINNVEKSGRFLSSICASSSPSNPHLVWQFGSSTYMQSDRILGAHRNEKFPSKLTRFPYEVFFPTRERWNMTYGGFYEVPLKGHFKWTTYQISNLFKAHDSNLLCAPRFTEREQRLSGEVFRSFSRAFVELRGKEKMECPWQRKMANKVSKFWWRFKVLCVWRRLFVLARFIKTPTGHELWLIENTICLERKIDTTCSQNFERFLRYGIREGNFLYSPNDIVDADDTLGLLFVEHYGGLCNNPHEAAVTCQEAISVSFSLTFADHWKDGNRGKNVISLWTAAFSFNSEFDGQFFMAAAIIKRKTF